MKMGFAFPDSLLNLKRSKQIDRQTQMIADPINEVFIKSKNRSTFIFTGNESERNNIYRT